MRGTVAKRLRKAVNNTSSDKMMMHRVKDVQRAMPGEIDFTEDGFIKAVMRTIYRTCTFERTVDSPRRQYQLAKENHVRGS